MKHLLALLLLGGCLLGSTPHAAAQAPATPAAPAVPGNPALKLRYLELSVDGEDKLTKRVIWKKQDGKLLAMDFKKAFSLEWVAIPPDAQAFVVVPPGSEQVEADKWIKLDVAPVDSNCYFSLRKVNNIFPEVFDASYVTSQTFPSNSGNNALRPYPSPSPGAKGWVLIGSWSEAAKAWAAAYWVRDGDVSFPNKRVPWSEAPDKIPGNLLVSDYPLLLKTDHSRVSSPIGREVARPGTRVKGEAIWVEPSGDFFEVWALITVQ